MRQCNLIIPPSKIKIRFLAGPLKRCARCTGCRLTHEATSHCVLITAQFVTVIRVVPPGGHARMALLLIRGYVDCKGDGAKETCKTAKRKPKQVHNPRDCAQETSGKQRNPRRQSPGPWSPFILLASTHLPIQDKTSDETPVNCRTVPRQMQRRVAFEKESFYLWLYHLLVPRA